MYVCVSGQLENEIYRKKKYSEVHLCIILFICSFIKII